MSIEGNGAGPMGQTITERYTRIGEIAERCGPRVLGTVIRWAKDPELATDIMQDAYLRLMESRHIPRDPSKQEAALRKCARWAWINHWEYEGAQMRDFRQTAVFSRIIPATKDEGNVTSYPFEPLSPQTLEDEVLGGEAFEELKQAIKRLPIKNRVAVLLAAYRGQLTPEEKWYAESILGPNKTHDALISSSRKQLEARLRERGYPLHRSHLAPYTRNRTIQMAEYNKEKRQARRKQLT